MTEKIKIAASLLNEDAEIISLERKIKKRKISNIENFLFLNEEQTITWEEEKENVFFTILEKYKENSFDYFSLSEVSEILNLKVNKLNKEYDIDLVLYRIATNFNTKLQLEENGEIRIHSKDFENKFEYIMEDITEITQKIEKLQEIKEKITNEKEYIKSYKDEKDKIKIEEQKNNTIEKRIVTTKEKIMDKVQKIQQYIDYSLKK